MGRSDRVLLNQRIRKGEDNFRCETFCINEAAELISPFRDGFRKMIVSVNENGKEEGKVTHTFEFCKNAVAESKFCLRITPGICVQLLMWSVSDIKVDDTFKGFYEFCDMNDIPVVIVSRYKKLMVSPCCVFIPPQWYGTYYPRSPE